MRYDTPPFELGEVLSGTDADGNLINLPWLGARFMHPAQRLDGSNVRAGKGRYTGQGIVAVALRNTSGGTLYPKRIAVLGAGYDSTHKCFGHEEAEGLSTTTAQRRVVIVDPWVTSVADNEIFWGILEGRVLVKTKYADMVKDIAAGDPVVAATLNTTSGNSTAGGIDAVTLPGQTGATLGFDAALGVVGFAISAKTTQNTNTDCLINACIKFYG